MEEVLRFAPSPTGFLHVGGARTAIFNWLIARKYNGKFLLRIEDTDLKRSTRESIEQIFSSLKWLGIDWDNEVHFQSQRRERHVQAAWQLLETGHAYRCFCSREELAYKRKIAEQNKINQRYDGACRSLTETEIRHKLTQNIPFSIRLKIPTGEVIFDDLIHGPTHVHSDTLDDFIVLRSDDTPVYQLAVVVDDHDMGVTKILRGDDHIANTPKQILIYQALEWAVPQFGHLPLILGADKARLSKRHGAASVEEFRDKGILPEALFNYLCLLGWSPGDDREILSLQEIIVSFDEKKINNRSAIFDLQKLYWMNGKYIGNLSIGRVLEFANTWLQERGYCLEPETQKRFQLFVELLKNRAQTINELTESLDIFFNDPEVYDEIGSRKYLCDEMTFQALRELHDELLKKDENLFAEVNTLDAFIRTFAEQRALTTAKIIHPLRLALTGKTTSPGIFEMMYILGKTNVLRRISHALKFIRQFSILNAYEQA